MATRHSDPAPFQPAWWLPGGHTQTLWGKFARRVPKLRTDSERLESPDGDMLELVHLPGEAPAGRPRLLLLHGLEGSPRSHYVGGLFAAAHALGISATLMVFRGCGAAPNTARRFYHSGETTDLAFVLDTLGARWPESTWWLVGVSLGGNVVLKFLGEQSGAVSSRIRGAVAVSVPFDLEAGARHIARGIARVYDRSFLRSLRRKALDKLTRYPDLFDRDALVRARHVHEFDDVVTAPVHGFDSAHDYYTRSSSLGFLHRIRVPTLLLSAEDDPFLPRTVLEQVSRVARDNPAIHLEVVPRGGHVGFVGGRWPWKPFYYAEWRAVDFLRRSMESGGPTGYD